MELIIKMIFFNIINKIMKIKLIKELEKKNNNFHNILIQLKNKYLTSF
jgi:hypothetical protein